MQPNCVLAIIHRENMNAIRTPTLAFFLTIATFQFPQPSPALTKGPLTGYTETQFDSLARELGHQLSRVTTTEVEKRKEARRNVQQRGYQNVLLELLHEDSLASLLAFLKMNMEIRISLPHNTVYVTQRLDSLYLAVPLVFRYEDGTELIFETQKVRLAIKEDWTMPKDLWKKER